MGERKGQNFYYPPDFDPKVHGSLNGYHGVHALRERARKMDRGILIIRFEMPYNIWCGGCSKHIGMGVRYNAEKTKVGMYYTTPVYQFRMKCHLCTNHFSIKTDPGNMDYVIVEGATRQERRWDPTENGQVVPDDKAVGKKLADDAMYKLEHQSTDRGKSKDFAPRLVGISDIQDRVKDDYLANRMLRDRFRQRKKVAALKKSQDAKVLARSGLALDLVDECPEDVRLAQLLAIQARKEAEELQAEGRNTLGEQDIFTSNKNKSEPANPARSFMAKVANSNQTKLIVDKGFGKAKSKLGNQLGVIAKRSTSTSKSSAADKRQDHIQAGSHAVSTIQTVSPKYDVNTVEPTSSEVKEAENSDKIVEPGENAADKNSLSLLCSYSGSSDDSD